MDISFIEKDKKSGRVAILLKGANPAFANALRRAIIDTVPTMAIEDVEFSKNSSVLYDEIVAHRLGLLPLKTDLKSYTVKSKCKCKGEGCARCTLKLTLKAKGPGYVYASDIKSKDPKVKPVYPKMPIIKLLKGQEVELIATAVLGTGSEHVKWSPGLVWYKYKPVIDIDSGKCNNAQECADSCPVHVFDVKGSKLAINKDNHMKCHLCGACADVASNNSIKLNESDSDFVFYIEPWGQLSPREMFTAAIDELTCQFDDFADKLSELK